MLGSILGTREEEKKRRRGLSVHFRIKQTQHVKLELSTRMLQVYSYTLVNDGL